MTPGRSSSGDAPKPSPSVRPGPGTGQCHSPGGAESRSWEQLCQRKETALSRAGDRFGRRRLSRARRHILQVISGLFGRTGSSGAPIRQCRKKRVTWGVGRKKGEAQPGGIQIYPNSNLLRRVRGSRRRSKCHPSGFITACLMTKIVHPRWVCSGGSFVANHVGTSPAVVQVVSDAHHARRRDVVGGRGLDGAGAAHAAKDLDGGNGFRGRVHAVAVSRR